MITADQVVAALSPVLDDLVRLSERVRMVGTASSALRGVTLPVGDVDILARDRDTVDELVLAFGSASATVIETPFGHQYLADHSVGGAPVQISTLESTVSGRRRLAECVGQVPTITARRWSTRVALNAGYVSCCLSRRAAVSR